MVGRKRKIDEDEWDESDQEYDDEYESPSQKKPRYSSKRVLQRWNVSHDQYLLLTLVEVCRSKNITLPWGDVGELCDPVVTEQSIKQHLAKMRKHREDKHWPNPPQLARSRTTSAKKPQTAQAFRKGSSLLPPETLLRATQKKRSVSKVDPVESNGLRAKANISSDGALSRFKQSDAVQPVSRISAPVDQVSGFRLGTAECGKRLCDEVDSFCALTHANMPKQLDFLGNSYDYIFDPTSFMGSNLEIHQRIIHQAAERSIDTGHYPGDEVVMATAKQAGYSGGEEDVFEMKQFFAPVDRHQPVVAARNMPVESTGFSLTYPQHPQELHATESLLSFKPPTAPMMGHDYPTSYMGTAPDSSAFQPAGTHTTTARALDPTSRVEQCKHGLGITDPIYLDFDRPEADKKTYARFKHDQQNNLNVQNMSTISWSPNTALYIAAPAMQGVSHEAALYSNVLFTTPRIIEELQSSVSSTLSAPDYRVPDSLDASQDVSPALSRQNSNDKLIADAASKINAMSYDGSLMPFDGPYDQDGVNTDFIFLDNVMPASLGQEDILGDMPTCVFGDHAATPLDTQTSMEASYDFFDFAQAEEDHFDQLAGFSADQELLF